jgi:hypothetical protein
MNIEQFYVPAVLGLFYEEGVNICDENIMVNMIVP